MQVRPAERTLHVVGLDQEVLLHPPDDRLRHLLVPHTGRDHKSRLALAVQGADAPPCLEGNMWVLDEVVEWDGARVGR